MMNFMRKVDAFLVYPSPNPPVLWREKLRSHAFTTALLKIMYGLCLLNPFQHVFSIAPAYAVMAQYGNETFWGLLFLSVGVAQMYTLWFDYIHVRSYINYIALLLMIFVTTMLFVSGVATTGITTYGSIAICDAISIIFPRHPRTPYIKETNTKG